MKCNPTAICPCGRVWGTTTIEEKTYPSEGRPIPNSIQLILLTNTELCYLQNFSTTQSIRKLFPNPVVVALCSFPTYELHSSQLHWLPTAPVATHKDKLRDGEEEYKSRRKKATNWPGCGAESPSVLIVSNWRTLLFGVQFDSIYNFHFPHGTTSSCSARTVEEQDRKQLPFNLKSGWGLCLADCWICFQSVDDFNYTDFDNDCKATFRPWLQHLGLDKEPINYLIL